jgi:hypothetical protein
VREAWAKTFYCSKVQSMFFTLIATNGQALLAVLEFKKLKYMIPTKDELIAIVCDRLGMFSNDAVEDLADELIRRWNISQNSNNAIVSGALPPMVEIEFGNHLYAKIDLQDGVKVLNVVNGWGDKVDLDLVKVKAAMTV